MKYKIKFEFFGKYMQTTVDAENVKHAKYIVKNRINFISITEESEPTPPEDIYSDIGEKMFGDQDVIDFLLGKTGWKK